MKRGGGRKPTCECGICPKCLNRARMQDQRATNKINEGLAPNERRGYRESLVFRGEFPRVRFTLTPLDVLSQRNYESMEDFT